ncbi:MAG: molybdopterin synthase catalytic subunit MoaE [Bermanella sp.]
MTLSSPYDFLSVQEADFDVAHEYAQLRDHNSQDGAIVFFSGLVRDFNQGSDVTGLFLEHSPAMTEKALAGIITQAKQRWPLSRVRLIHRVGQLQLAEQIVFVGVSSSHREAAFEACHFIMDYLKKQAPFWKKETTRQGPRWVETLKKDEEALHKWQQDDPKHS